MKRVDIIKIHIEFNISSKTPQKITFIHCIEGKAFQNAKRTNDKITNDNNKEITESLRILLWNKALTEKIIVSLYSNIFIVYIYRNHIRNIYIFF